MERRTHIFSWMGSIFVVCILFASVFASGKKAEAALAVKEIDYEKSTITITSTSGDTTLYFSDKRKTKWEMVTEQFQNGECTMDISWVSMTQNYELTFKGDKTNKSEEILSVIIPKQEKGFKAKYNLKTKEITFTGAGSRNIEYRKNNTENWSPFTDSAALKPVLERLSENGASVYFRLKAEKGTSASSAGYRASKEVACKISKKTAAPNVTINTSDSTIAVQSGWQVREVEITEKSGVQYASSLGEWKTYSSAKDVPLGEIASGAVYKAGEDQSAEKKDVYLQFRKSATSTAQLSYITTIKVPAQEAAPTKEDSGISMEFTSPTSFKLTISAASPMRQYEYCIVDAQDMKGDTITDPESITWKTISSATATEIKKADAPQNSVIFYRKKAVGKTGDKDFKLATPYTKFGAVSYTGLSSSDMSIDQYVFDGVCVTGNSSGNITFGYNSSFNSKITSIGLSTTPNPTAAGDCTVTLTSTVASNSASTSGSDKYIVTTTITNISLSSNIKEQLKNAGTKGLTLYAYITLSSGEPIQSNDTTGLRIHMMQASTIEKDTTDTNSTLNVTRFVGSSTTSECNQYEDFSFQLTPGYEYGKNLGNYGTGNMEISSVQLGNYSLTPSDYAYDSAKKKFTVHLSNFETSDALIPYYDTTQNLVIKLSNGEKLTGVSVKLAAPVSLKDTYSWAFTKGQLVEEKTTTTKDEDGNTITTTVKVNSYSVEYQQSSATSNGVSVTSCTFQSAELNGTNIVASTEKGNEIVFSNQILNKNGSTGDVQIKFNIVYSNGATQDYTITKGCHFNIL